MPYVDTVSPPVHLSFHLSVTFCQQLYYLSDFHQILYRCFLLKVVRQIWFSWKLV